MQDALGAWGHGGKVDCAFLTAAQVDRYGNTNTLVIGDYASPRRRLAGTGGNADLACTAKRAVVIMSLEARRFVERVDFISSPAYIDRPGARGRAGLAPPGPHVARTPRGLLGLDPPAQDVRARLDIGRRAAGPHRRVLDRHRRAEERHHPVARHLLDGAVVGVHGLVQLAV